MLIFHFGYRAKKDNAEYKRQARATGGGKPPTTPDETSTKVLDVIRLEVDDVDNPHDSDAHPLSKQ